MNDAALLETARAGDEDAFARLVEPHRRALHAHRYRMLGTVEDAEDVVHDVFVGLPEALRRYQERGSLGPWLRTITARTALMQLREQSARSQVGLDEAKLPAALRALDTTLTIEQALRALSPNLRAVLVLKEIEGFSHAEIAAMLDISVGASEVRLHRALQALRTILLEDDPR